MQFGRRTQSAFSDCIVFITTNIVYIACVWRKEAREEWELMKLMHADVNLKLLEALLD